MVICFHLNYPIDRCTSHFSVEILVSAHTICLCYQSMRFDKVKETAFSLSRGWFCTHAVCCSHCHVLHLLSSELSILHVIWYFHNQIWLVLGCLLLNLLVFCIYLGVQFSPYFLRFLHFILFSFWFFSFSLIVGNLCCCCLYQLFHSSMSSMAFRFRLYVWIPCSIFLFLNLLPRFHFPPSFKFLFLFGFLIGVFSLSINAFTHA